LLDVPFNRARSCTKVLDITHCGAVGIYASNSACAEMIDNGIDGLVVGPEPDAWVQAILRLAGDEPLRQQMLRNAQLKQTEFGHKARSSYSGLLDYRAHAAP
jgi:glycosyltransferase involved in cell wall biosynthesis